MERIGVRQLRNNSAAWIRRAHDGEQIIITVDGVPTAQLGPLHLGTSPTIDSLVAQGLVTDRRQAPHAEPDTTLPTWTGTRLDAVLREVRGR